MPVHVMVDTNSFTQRGGFDNPDLRKLLQQSKDDQIQIHVPHIVWEERRAQLTETCIGKLRRAGEEIEKLNEHLDKKPAFSGLPRVAPPLFSEEELESASRAWAAAFALEHKLVIEVMSPDHAERAWKRYFGWKAPFSTYLGNENRNLRKHHIPDSWIYECALDLRAKHPELIACCGDGVLSRLLESSSIKCFATPEKLVAHLEELAIAAAPTAAPPEPIQAALGQPPTPTPAVDPVDAALAATYERSRETDRKVLGFIGSFPTASKDQLFSVLDKIGIGRVVADNAAQRFALSGIIKDTGNHYLPIDKVLCEQAAKLVEAEMIRALRPN